MVIKKNNSSGYMYGESFNRKRSQNHFDTRLFHILTMNILTDILFFTACGVIVVYIVLLIREMRKIKSIKKRINKMENKKYDSNTSTTEIIKDLLKSMNCEFELKNTENDAVSIDFSFQGGNFSIDIAKNNSLIKIFYLFLHETSTKNLSIVRHLCNQLNINSRMPKFIYSIDDVKNKIYIHIYTCALFINDIPDLKNYFENLLTGNFELQRIFSYKFKELEKESGPTYDDIEENNSNWRRQLFLLREHEIMHQQGEADARYNETECLTVGQLLKTVYGHRNITPVSMRVVTDEEMSTISDQDAVVTFDLIDAILDLENHDKPILKNKLVTLIITCRQISTSKKESCRLVTVTLTPEGESDHSVYFRLSTSLTAMNINKMVAQSKANNTASAYSMIIAYDFASPKQKLAEFNYMCEDAVSKLKNKQISELSEEQQLLIMCNNANPSYNLYWGKKLYLDGRYYEALLHLENGFFELQARFNQMSKSQKNVFFELCYLIGYCYCELKQYQRAYYFLDALPQLNNIVYTQEYINCLTNAKDYRALAVIDNLLTFISKDTDTDDEEVNEALSSFLNFLRRRKAFVHIDLGELTEAEKIYTQMLDEPENIDYALNELAYIQKLKSESSETL